MYEMTMGLLFFSMYLWFKRSWLKCSSEVSLTEYITDSRSSTDGIINIHFESSTWNVSLWTFKNLIWKLRNFCIWWIAWIFAFVEKCTNPKKKVRYFVQTYAKHIQMEKKHSHLNTFAQIIKFNFLNWIMKFTRVIDLRLLPPFLKWIE